MTDKELRVKVAELCGWESFPLSDDYPNWWKKGKDERINWNYLPDYPNDLNAMHEAENTIHNESFDNPEWLEYLHNLDVVINQRRAHATARQRAEAFVLTMETK